jgi:hypothetical protein
VGRPGLTAVSRSLSHLPSRSSECVFSKSIQFLECVDVAC